MNSGITKGIGFGLTSGVITTLGMTLALYLLSESKTIIVGGIISIAIADSVSDALGIHISEESEKEKKFKQIWTATIWTFLSKFFITSSFLIPILIFPLDVAIAVSILLGYFLIISASIKIARERRENIPYAVIEHLTITTFVLLIIFLTEKFIHSFQ
ncbi:MAG: hypothetical protein WHT47_01060 [Hydrogenothermaceae bacterium]